VIKKIFYKKKILAIIIKKNFYKKKGISFVTPNHYNLQLGFMNHPKNYKIKPHLHFQKKIKRINTSEVLYLIEGKLRINFYNKKKEYLFSEIINKGETVMLINEGHGFDVLKKTILLEVKQGPYNIFLDKIKFNEKSKKKSKIQ
jgi:hypothetical protein